MTQQSPIQDVHAPGVLAVSLRDPRELKPWSGNPRQHSRKQIKQILRSIRETGFYGSLVIDEQNTVIAGHGRLEAALELGMAEVPCNVVGHLTQVQNRA